MDTLTARFNKEVFVPYLELLKAEYRFHLAFSHAREMWEAKLTMAELINGPYLEKSQMYAPGDSMETLPLHEKTTEAIRRRLSGRGLYKHQTDALKLLLSEQNTVIATGTSSGKTLCYQIPILNDLLRDPSPGLRAIIIYPLNALVNDQLEEWETMLKGHKQITFARFTGQTPDTQTKYVERLKASEREKLADRSLKVQEREREVQRAVAERLRNDPPNRLNHRDAIRANPPHILVTNFSMLEYLLERPVDAPIFEHARLKFLVLDEAHAYRGVQATEIAFLVRRLKDRLGVEKLTCVATSATLGKRDNEESRIKVRRFASEIFDGEFNPPNPIYGTPAEPLLEQPSYRPTATQYIKAAATLRKDGEIAARQQLASGSAAIATLAQLLGRDENLYRLRKEILVKPTLLSEAARQLWPGDSRAEDGLQALLEIVAAAMQDEAHGDLLPTRLHYFVRAQAGLHVCLHQQCPGRRDSKPAFFVSRKAENSTAPEGQCPLCWQARRSSQLVEVVTCRKCGYLYGALQDLGPRRARYAEQESGAPEPHFDSFSTELGWGGDSFWSYFSVESDLPYPAQTKLDVEDDDLDKLFLDPTELNWCVVCGKKNDKGRGDNCSCESPHLRRIKVFHRQCSADRYENLYGQQKKLLVACPNCGARNSSGLEPVRRFQESDDETGLAMAVPLAHFQVSAHETNSRPPRKLLCFTDHRQRAAAFPALLEEETFTHDLGRKIVKVVRAQAQPLDLISLGELLADIAAPESDDHDPDFFLPVSRYPDERPDAKKITNLWLAEVFSYFGIPDSARESAEDLGLVTVEYELKDDEEKAFYGLLAPTELSASEATAALQTLLGFVRQRKAFTLPQGRVAYDDVAFGRVPFDIGFALRREGKKYIEGWLPRLNKDGIYRDNNITDYLQRLLRLSSQETLVLAEKVWDFLTSQFLLIDKSGKWKLDHERLFLVKPAARYVCDRCGIVKTYAARDCCPRKGCIGRLQEKAFDPAEESIIARWVADAGEPRFTTLKSEEHTAQVNKDVAKRIEDEFRAEGVNLLSSTTTFEMGINIGDLQKVLLRNAPPTSASYVQRVGRAGRGKDKNAVCVTLCRRTRYDADAWRDPAARLMSGEIRTPTVFTENRVIAQRHFNAVLFARFLRVRIRDEKALREIKQQTPLAPFLPLVSQTGIPESWLGFHPSDLHLDFCAWLAEQNEGDFFQTSAKSDLLKAVSSFSAGREKSVEKYVRVLESIAEELSALMTERKRLFGQGDSTEDIDRAVKNLLKDDVISVLAKRGFLPRYAFPLDVVNLETGWSRWSGETDVELSRDRAIAIAEFAPGAQVIARKKIFTSAGLYIVSRTDKPERRWYSQCRDCKQIRTARTQDELLGACRVCQKTISSNDINSFVEPQAFSIRLDRNGASGERHRRTSLIRQRQSVTHFIDSVEESSFLNFGLFDLALKEDGTLFRYNLGPKNEGFMLCPVCGCSEPMSVYKPSRKHRRLRAFGRETNCTNETPWTKRLGYGHQFQSFCLIARPKLPNPPLESLSFALQKGLCQLLDIEPSDIGVTGRWLANRNAASARAEIVLFDKTPGGAGFVREGINDWPRVVERASALCQNCACEKSCYECLKDYGNQSFHDRLDRGMVVDFLDTY